MKQERQIKTGRFWLWVLGLGLLAFTIALGYELWQDHRFEKLTPAEHLQSAKKEIATDGEESTMRLAARHLAAIPSKAPERGEADRTSIIVDAELRQISERAKTLANVEADRSPAPTMRQLAVSQMNTDLKNLGYELKVEESANDTITITSKDFGDSDHRVRFLSFLRAKRSPAAGACSAGFSHVRLKDQGFLGFDETYALQCSSI